MATDVASGTSVASLPTGGGTIQFADRYGYMQVTNTDAATIYVSSDPATALPSDTNDGIPVAVGDSVLVANQNPLWYQSSRLLVPGDDNANAQSKTGGLANPGTTVSASGACTVSAAG